MPQAPSSSLPQSGRLFRTILDDLDDTSMRIFKMYHHMSYLPHSKRISNIAWRIQSMKIMLKRPHEISPHDSASSNTCVDAADFDYATHILHLLRQDSTQHSQSLNHSLSSLSTRHNQSLDHSLSSNPLYQNQSLNRSISLNSGHQNYFPQGISRIPPSSIEKLLGSQPIQPTTNIDHHNSRTPTTNLSPFHLERSDLRVARETALRRSSLLTRRMPYSDPDSQKPVLQCSHCFSQSTPMWRQGPGGELLCNACGLYNKLHGNPRQSNAIRLKDRQVQVNNTRLFMSGTDIPISTHTPTRAEYSAYAANDEIPDWDKLLAAPGSNIKSSPSNTTQSAYAFQGLAHAAGELSNMDIDEIDNLLNMNLFHPESFTANDTNSTRDQVSHENPHNHRPTDPFMNNASAPVHFESGISSSSVRDPSASGLVDNNFDASSFDTMAFAHIDSQFPMPSLSSTTVHPSLISASPKSYDLETSEGDTSAQPSGTSLYRWLNLNDPSSRPR